MLYTVLLSVFVGTQVKDVTLNCWVTVGVVTLWSSELCWHSVFVGYCVLCCAQFEIVWL